MNISKLSFIVIAILSFSSCAPYTGSSDVTDRRSDMTALPNNFSLLDLGRTLSKGCVDIFDPWLNNFQLPMSQPPENMGALLTFPEHPYMIVRDSSVSVYTLKDSNAQPYNQFFNIMENQTLEIPAAVPLIEESRH
jgi:hypothetical protein